MTIRADNRHLYLQVIDRIKEDIHIGVYKERQKLPSEFELSKHLGISRATLREALRILEEENVVIRRHGVGTFVNSKPIFSSGIEELFSVTKMIERVGKTPGTKYISSTTKSATDEEIKRFNLESDDAILVVERLRTADHQPVVYCIDKLPQIIVAHRDINKAESLFEALEHDNDRRIEYAITTIEPIGYHEKISPILQCEPETALLLLKQMHYDQNDQPVLYSCNYFKADMFSFHVVRKEYKTVYF